jgi:hypothetical protein
MATGVPIVVRNEKDLKHMKEVVDSVLVYLDKVYAGANTNSLYCSGEEDSSQTTFEKRSNHLEVGVLAPNKDVAKTMLFVLRMIIDGNLHLAFDRLESELEEDEEEKRIDVASIEPAIILQNLGARKNLWLSLDSLLLIWRESKEFIKRSTDPLEPIKVTLVGGYFDNEQKFHLKEQTIFKEWKDVDKYDLPRLLEAWRAKVFA